MTMTKSEAKAVWNSAVKEAADEWRAERGTNIIDPSGASSAFTMHAWKVFQDMGDEVKTALDPDDSQWLHREFNRAVVAQL